MKKHYKTLMSVLDGEDRRSFIIFILVSFISGVIEVIGIGSIMPFIGALLQPDLITTNKILSSLNTLLGFTSPQQFLVFMGSATIFLIVTGGVISIYSVRYQLKITYRIGHKWAVKLLSAYLNQPYKFYLEKNSNSMKATVLSEVDRAVSSILLPSAIFISRAMVICIILSLLLFINLFVTLVLAGITGTIYGGLLVYFRHKMKLKGQDAVAQNKIRFQTTSEAFSSIRDIKLYDNADYFIDKFSAASALYATNQSYSLFHGQIPRFIIEMTGFVTLIALTLYLTVSSGNTVSDVIPLIALFAAAGYKILPAAQNLYSSLNSIRFNEAALAIVATGINTAPPLLPVDTQPHPAENFSGDIEVKNLSFFYTDPAQPVLKNITCTIRKNSLVGVSGSTGAGKSTFIDLLIGLLEPQAGEILVNGQKISLSTTKHWQKEIGYVPQSIYLIESSIEKNIAFGLTEAQIDPEKIRIAARHAQIEDFITSLPDQYETSVGEHGDRLSGGQRQRVGIARALYRSPAILVFDEPTSALDNKTAQDLLVTLKALAQEKTVIVITHSVDLLKSCDQVLYLDQGQLQKDQTFPDLLSHNVSFANLVSKH